MGRSVLTGRRRGVTPPPASPVPLPLAGEVSAPDFRYIGEVFRTYLLVEQGEELILIDKHAAHERINFERLLAQGTQILGQTLLQPLALRFDREEAALLAGNRELLLSLGYDLDDLGEGDLLLRQMPSDVPGADAIVMTPRDMNDKPKKAQRMAKVTIEEE